MEANKTHTRKKKEQKSSTAHNGAKREEKCARKDADNIHAHTQKKCNHTQTQSVLRATAEKVEAEL